MNTSLAPASSSLTSAKPGQNGLVNVNIITRTGEHYRYRAQDVTLNMRQGALRIIEKDFGCFVLFDHCNIEVADSRGTPLFRLTHCTLSHPQGSDLSIIADFAEEV